MSIIRNNQRNKDINNLVNMLVLYIDTEKIYICKKNKRISITPCCKDDIEIDLYPLIPTSQKIIDIFDENKDFHFNIKKKEKNLIEFF